MTHSAGAGDLDAYVSTMHKMSALLRVSNFFGTSCQMFLFFYNHIPFFLSKYFKIGGIVLFLIMSNIGIKLKLVLSKKG